MNIYFKTLALSLVATLAPVSLPGQEEPDRPAGEVTEEMARQRIPKSWVGAGGEPGVVTDNLMPRQGGPGLPRLIPTPQEIYPGGRIVSLGAVDGYSLEVRLAGEASRIPLLGVELEKRIARIGGKRGSSGGSAGPVLVFALDSWHLPFSREKLGGRLATLTQTEGYVLSVEQKDGRDFILVLGKTEEALWRAMTTVAQLITAGDGKLSLPAVEIIDHPQMEQRSLLVDIGGQGFMVGPARWEFDQWVKFIDWMVDHKFNEIWFEIIGSGRLMGNLSMEAGEWIGFPLELKSYPQLVCRDRPIRRWDESSQKVVEDTYTAPNVRKEFLRELIDYAQARGMKAVLFIGYDYFANQLPYVLGVPANDPTHPEANKIYDTLLREIVQRYDNAQGVIVHTIENKNVPPEMVDHVVRRTHEARAIVKSINPEMDLGILNDYLEWRPREEFERYSATLPEDVYQVYSPHSGAYGKAWKRIHRNVFRYELYTQYAWNHAVYILPERIKREIQEDYISGYRKVVSQAWYFDVFALNFMTMAEMAWNSTGLPLDQFWNSTLEAVFGAAAAPHMKTAFKHTRFDRRLDITGRMLMRDDPAATYQFWDMYKLSHFPAGIDETFLSELATDAKASLEAATAALPLVKQGDAREMIEMTITSAERRLHMGTSAIHYLRARRAHAAGDRAKAAQEMEQCLAVGAKMVRSATKLGIEFPMAVHDDEIMERYREFKALVTRSK